MTSIFGHSNVLSVGQPSALRHGGKVRQNKDWFRSSDVALALLVLIAVLPMMCLIAAAIRLTGSGPVLFKHRRVGKGGREFYCFKFRTMATDADARLEALLRNDEAARREWAHTQKLRHDPRITMLGGFLRKSSLDELPQLFNVLNGTMSWVGPRPIVANEITRYGNRFQTYCEVRPGITGLWQVSGRNNISYRRRVAMDVLYVRSRNVRLNGMILAKTLPAVLQQRGSC